MLCIIYLYVFVCARNMYVPCLSMNLFIYLPNRGQPSQMAIVDVWSLWLITFVGNMGCQPAVKCRHNGIPGSARHAPGRKFRKLGMTRRNQWPIGKLLRCRSNEVLKLWGASTNEQKVVEMPMTWHERTTALNEWGNGPMNQWISEWFQFQWFNERRSNKAMNQWINGSTTSWVSETTCHWTNEPMMKRSSESMNQRRNESVNQWSSASLNQGITESMNQQFEGSMNQ